MVDVRGSHAILTDLKSNKRAAERQDGRGVRERLVINTAKHTRLVTCREPWPARKVSVQAQKGLIARPSSRIYFNQGTHNSRAIIVDNKEFPRYSKMLIAPLRFSLRSSKDYHYFDIT